MMVARKVLHATLPPGFRPAELNKRRHRGELALPAARDGMVPGLDLVEVRLIEGVRDKTNLFDAGALVHHSYRQWAPCVSACENMPPEDRASICLAIIDDGSPLLTIRAGHIEACVADLPPGTRSIRIISLGQILAELRADAERAGIELPPRLAPVFGSAEFEAWVAQIGGGSAAKAAEAARERRAAAEAQLAELDRQQKALRREMREMTEALRELGRPDLTEEVESGKPPP